MASTKKSKEESPTKKKKLTNEHTQENGHINGKGNSRKKNKEEEEEEEMVIEELEDDVISIPNSSASDSEEGTIEITGDEDEEEIEETEEVEEVKGKSKKKGKSRDSEDGTMFRFPMARIKRIMKAENPALQAGADVVFLLNKATEKFLEQFCEEAYDTMVRDSKKALAYKHLASVVKDEERYDFLRDYVPEKMTAKDALKERNSAEMS